MSKKINEATSTDLPNAFQYYVDERGESRNILLLPVEYKGVIPRTKMNKPKCTPG